MTAHKSTSIDFGTAASARRKRPASGAAPASAATVGASRKYTVILDDEAADAFDGRLLAIRRSVGRKVDKSHVIRELLALLDEDASLTAQVVDRLKLR